MGFFIRFEAGLKSASRVSVAFPILASYFAFLQRATGWYEPAAVVSEAMPSKQQKMTSPLHYILVVFVLRVRHPLRVLSHQVGVGPEQLFLRRAELEWLRAFAEFGLFFQFFERFRVRVLDGPRQH